ncbi:MAG: hypothetical protein KC442_19705, partial [Thermomicrobiales bacterium]|nr:hypothetical protein [Thermomicrobiales bacterium]
LSAEAPRYPDHANCLCLLAPVELSVENALSEMMADESQLDATHGGGGMSSGGASSPGGSGGSGPGRIAPVSDGFEIPPRPTAQRLHQIYSNGEVDLHGLSVRMVNIIDSVHTDGVLPRIPIVRLLRPDPGQRGALGFHSMVSSAQAIRQAARLAINTEPSVQRTAPLTFAHETGHFLDLEALGVRGVVASDTHDLIMAGWQAAVDNTAAVQALRDRRATGSAIVTMPSGAVIASQVSVSYVDYLLLPRELWARSYAQYIAEKSGDIDMRNALDLDRFPSLTGLLYPQQWETSDFAPVLDAIDTLFRGLGWIP